MNNSNKFGKDFWNERWQKGETGWDMGSPSTPLKEYIDGLDSNEDKYLKILIPGCGNAYEAEYLNAKGFRNVYVVDFAKKALDEFADMYGMDVRDVAYALEQVKAFKATPLSD